MSTSYESFKTGARRLPDIRLAALETGAPTPLRAPGRRAPLVVLLHGEGCPQCDAHLAELTGAQPRMAEWDGRPVAVRSGQQANADEGAPGGVTVLADPDEKLANALSVEAPATIVADQWGEIHEIVDAGPNHAFMSVDELVEWARSIAIRCPECEGEAF